MARWTQAERDAIKNTLPGGEEFNGQYWWLNRVGPANKPTGVTAAKDPTAATFGAVMEHDSAIDGTRCALQIIAADRVPDVGFTGTNSIEVTGGFRDGLTCPACGLTGSIHNKAWTSG